jgi:type II secretory pathway pseudopilin PulG
MRRMISIIELLLVLGLIAILALAVVPRLTRAGPRADETGLRARLVLLRCAIERYYYDHGTYPGQRDDGTHAAFTAQACVTQLTWFTDEHGHAAPAADAAHRFGPYLRAGIPACPVPPHRHASGLALVTTEPVRADPGADAGWVYNCRTGSIAVNSALLDAAGSRYDQY